jgi:hypothetical protein
MRALTNLDVIVLVAALPVFIVAGLPILGWAGAAGLWAIQRVIQELAVRRVTEATDVQTRMGVAVGSMIGRGWLVALGILAIGLANNKAGLTAAVLFLIVFTLHFTFRLVAGGRP